MQPHLTPPLGKSTVDRALPSELIPGFGGSGLHIGQSDGNVVDLWGPPEKQEQQNGSTFYVYPKLGLEIEFQDLRIERLFFYRSHAGQYGKSSSPHVDGIRFGAPRSEVLERFGPAISSGEPRKILGEYVRGWLCYSAGVQFEFDKNQKLSLITIFRPEKI